MVFLRVIVYAFIVAMVVGMWKVFVKAGKPGWIALIPIYRLYCLTEMTLGKGLLCLLFLVPLVGQFIMPPIICMKLAKFFYQFFCFIHDVPSCLTAHFIFSSCCQSGRSVWSGP